jgi:molecular chaperone HtpG
MVESAAAGESLEFRAEVQQLLGILAHSLYTEREIFLRELISNASDALNRIQFQLLTDRDLRDPDAELAVRLSFDDQAHTLTVADTGVGMTREELIENLGTIAHSGALAFLKGLEEGQRPADIIGQFGVGFYSVFMVADEVSVTTLSWRRDAEAWRWTSTGASSYTLQPAEKTERGTAIEIRLKEDAHDFASAWRLEQVVRKHSDYISFPIYVAGKVANQRSAPWRKPLNEVQPNEYDDFYRQLTLDSQPPMLHVHVITDAPVDIRSILYVPRRREGSPLRLQPDYGPRLYCRKVLIQEHGKDLLPEYLRFVEGVVDSEDLPLNISRETVQSNRALRQIQKTLAGRLLKALGEMSQERPADYKTFWQEFGPFIKQGIAIGTADREEIVPLLRFTSSTSGGELVSLADYAGRMGAEQKEIYYILGEEASAVANSPHLDPFKARALEVLFFLDPLDGFMVQTLREYQGKTLRNVDDPVLALPPAPAAAPAAEEAGGQGEIGPLLARIKAVLGERVTDVRVTDLLTDSPCRLVSPGGGAERDLQRVRRLLEQDYKVPAKIMEVNPRHAILRNLSAMLAARPDDALIAAAIEQLYADMLLLEGLLPNPADMVPRLQALLEAATRSGGQAA